MVRPGFTLTEETPLTSRASAGGWTDCRWPIELAASRIRLLAPGALLARLDHSLGLAAADAGRPLRQQTLRSTIAWSYDLLSSDSAEVLRRSRRVRRGLRP